MLWTKKKQLLLSHSLRMVCGLATICLIGLVLIAATNDLVFASQSWNSDTECCRNINPRYPEQLRDFMKSHDVAVVGTVVRTEVCIDDKLHKIKPERIDSMNQASDQGYDFAFYSRVRFTTLVDRCLKGGVESDTLCVEVTWCYDVLSCVRPGKTYLFFGDLGTFKNDQAHCSETEPQNPTLFVYRDNGLSIVRVSKSLEAQLENL